MHNAEQIANKELILMRQRAVLATMYGEAERIYERGAVDTPEFLSSNKQLLYNKLKRKITKANLGSYLQQKEPHTLHKNVVRRFRRNHYFVFEPFALHEADLVDMSMYSDTNDGYKYLLTVIDAFTKVGHAELVKSKTGPNITQAYRRILDASIKAPKVLQTDRGLEFKNAHFKTLLGIRGIRLRHPLTTSAFKCAFVENFNKTIKTKISRFFTHTGKRRYIDVLPAIIESYNSTPHSVTRFRPKDINYVNATIVYHNIHAKHRKEPLIYSAQKLQPHDYVRVALKKTALDRGVLKEQWSREIFIIDKIINRTPQKLYTLRDLNGNTEINGKFYEPELQKVIMPADTVMKVLKVKGLGANKKQYVLYFDGTKKWI